MAANTSPIFTLLPLVGVGALSAANTARDGTGTIVTVFTPDATNGGRIQKVEIIATGTTTAGVIRLFLHDGSSNHLWEEILVQAIIPSASVKVWRGVVFPNFPMALQGGWSLRASTNNAETFNAFVFGGDY